jgi:hypothetical protein
MNIKPINRICILFSILLFGILACNKDANVSSEKKETRWFPEMEEKKIVIKGITDVYSAEYGTLFTTKESSEAVVFDSLELQFEFDSNIPVIVKLGDFNRGIPIFALPGDTIIIDFKLFDFLNGKSTQRFSGKRKTENELLSKLNKILILDNPNNNYLYNIEESLFINKIDSLRALGLSFLKLPEQQALSPYFEKCYTTFLDYKLGSFLENYPSVIEGTFAMGKQVLSTSYYEKLRVLEKEDASLIGIYPYLEHLNRQVFKHSSNRRNPHTNFATIDALLTDSIIINQLKYGLVRDEIRIQAFQKERFLKTASKANDFPTINASSSSFQIENKLAEYMEEYRGSNPSEKYLNKIEGAYRKLMQD